ncbi:MAG: ATP-binding protein, partial [Patescibacteria group bacterium]
MNGKNSRQLIIDEKDCPNCQEEIKEETKSATIKEVISIVSHELRNPVMQIGGFTKRALDKLKEGKENQEGYMCYGKEQMEKIILYNEIIGREMKHLVSILDTINDFIVNDSIQLEEVDFRALLNEAIEAISDKRVHFLMQYELKEEPILDPVKIKMLILNILINAKEAILEERKRHCPDNHYRGEIEIAVCANSANENLFDITISNNGARIQKEDLPKIFEPFFTTKKSGEGIGLAVSKRIVTAHKGKISVECEPITRFIISLPMKMR